MQKENQKITEKSKMQKENQKITEKSKMQQILHLWSNSSWHIDEYNFLDLVTYCFSTFDI